MSRECRAYKKNLVAYMDHELPAHEAELTAAHIRRCDRCRRELRELQEVLQPLSQLQTVLPSDGYDRTFWQKVQAAESRHTESPMTWKLRDLFSLVFGGRLRLTASAAVALCALSVTVYALRPQRELTPRELSIARDIELYSNLDIIEKSDALEYFDIINMLDALEQEEQG